jgi:hypothetical protein
MISTEFELLHMVSSYGVTTLKRADPLVQEALPSASKIKKLMWNEVFHKRPSSNGSNRKYEWCSYEYKLLILKAMKNLRKSKKNILHRKLSLPWFYWVVILVLQQRFEHCNTNGSKRGSIYKRLLLCRKSGNDTDEI